MEAGAGAGWGSMICHQGPAHSLHLLHTKKDTHCFSHESAAADAPPVGNVLQVPMESLQGTIDALGTEVELARVFGGVAPGPVYQLR